MQKMGYIPAVFAAYLLGCSSMALYIAKRKQVDLRSGGSGNLGTSNVVAVIGWAEGFLVALHDVGKGALAVFLAQLCFPALPEIGVVAGVACVLGHIFPFYLKFRGGKGLAAFIGMTLVLNWKLAAIAVALMLLVTLITDYLVIGTAVVVLVVPAYLAIVQQRMPAALIVCIGTAVILWKHRENYVRILKGTEIGLRSGAKGDYRVK